MSGSSVIRAQLGSPLTLVVAALLAAAPLAAALLGGRLPGLRGAGRGGVVALALLVAVIGAVVLVAVPYATVRSNLDYGAWLEDGALHVRFYGADTATFNICNTNFKLLRRGELESILKYRAYGTGDPLAGISMGYYKTTDGRTAYVVVIGRGIDRILLADNTTAVALIGVESGDCIQNLYKAILQAKNNCTQQTSNT